MMNTNYAKDLLCKETLYLTYGFIEEKHLEHKRAPLEAALNCPKRTTQRRKFFMLNTVNPQ